MEQKLSDTLVKAIDRSNPMMQNLQLASRFNKLVEGGGGGGESVIVEPLSVTENGTYSAPSGKAYSPITVNVPSSGSKLYCYATNGSSNFAYSLTENVKSGDVACYADSYGKLLKSSFKVYHNTIQIKEWSYELTRYPDGDITLE